MVRAAARGTIDYRDADPRSPRWRLYTRLMLQEVQRADEARFHTVALHRLSAVLSLIGDAAEREKAFNETWNMLQRIRKQYFPWISEESTKELENALVSMSKQWESIWGDINDPETQAKIAATEAWLYEHDES